MTENSASITFRDNPWYMLLPAGLFAVVGAFFMALGIQESGRGSHHLSSFAAFSAGFTGLAGAFVLFRQAECIAVNFDRDRRVVTLDRRLLWRQQRDQWLFDDVETLDVERWDESDGPLWRPCLILKSGVRVPLTSWNNDKNAAASVCADAIALLKQ
jgi:hypothetical protein